MGREDAVGEVAVWTTGPVWTLWRSEKYPAFAENRAQII